MSPTDCPAPHLSDTIQTDPCELAGRQGFIRNTTAATILTTTMIVMSAIGNAHANIGVEDTGCFSRPMTTGKAFPKLAEQNQQIYEFLGGDITEKDSVASIGKKLKKKILSILDSTERFDEFSYYLGNEMKFRELNNKGESTVILEALQQMRNEQSAIQELSVFFKKIEDSGSGLSLMNDAIIGYYNSVGGNVWGEKELSEWRNTLEKQRKKDGYSFQTFFKWMTKYKQ